MTKLPRISGHQAIRALERLGFIQVRQRGSHVVLKNAATGKGTSVPLHRELAVGTLRGLLKLAEVDPQEFISKL